MALRVLARTRHLTQAHGRREVHVILPVDRLQRQSVRDVLEGERAVLGRLVAVADAGDVFVLVGGVDPPVAPVGVEREQHRETVAEDAEVGFQDG